MQKIMFNDIYGLTAAVLNGTKTQTRILVPTKVVEDFNKREQYCNEVCSVCRGYDKNIFFINRSPYHVGEIVAVAQAYKDIYNPMHVILDPLDPKQLIQKTYVPPVYSSQFAKDKAGWTNKMFVRANLMPHQIHITRVWIERLQDISDEDCLKEGVVLSDKKVGRVLPAYYSCQYLKDCAKKIGWGIVKFSPQDAYAELIDNVSGKGTWESNPYVYCYEFELVK